LELVGSVRLPDEGRSFGGGDMVEALSKDADGIVSVSFAVVRMKHCCEQLIMRTDPLVCVCRVGDADGNFAIGLSAGVMGEPVELDGEVLLRVEAEAFARAALEEEEPIVGVINFDSVNTALSAGLHWLVLRCLRHRGKCVEEFYTGLYNPVSLSRRLDGLFRTYGQKNEEERKEKDKYRSS